MSVTIWPLDLSSSGLFQTQIAGGGRSAQGVDDMLGRATLFDSFVIENDCESVVGSVDAFKLCARIELESLVSKGGLDYL